jgi:uncharacterized protein YqgC (DUF456 family)
MISIGKYQTKLYYKGRGFKGSLCTGILTLILSFLLIYYAVLVFKDIFQFKNYSLDLKSFEIMSLKSLKVDNITNSNLTD